MRFRSTRRTTATSLGATRTPYRRKYGLNDEQRRRSRTATCSSSSPRAGRFISRRSPASWPRRADVGAQQTGIVQGFIQGHATSTEREIDHGHHRRFESSSARVLAIGGSIAMGIQTSRTGVCSSRGFPPVREWACKVKPDVAVVFYMDHGSISSSTRCRRSRSARRRSIANADEGWACRRSAAARRRRRCRAHHRVADADEP